MDRCPAEICSEIYAYACVDNGRTGRSLSLVSTYIRDTSRPFKLQSVSVVGFQQLMSFAALLEDTPLHLRQVRCIFISAHAQSTATEPKALTPEYARRERAYGAVEKILHAISHCVIIVHALFLFHRPFPLLPVSLPFLQELSLHGPLDAASNVDEEIQFASLNHLHISSCYSPVYILGTVAKLTPNLKHLRISAPEHSPNFVDELKDILENATIPLPTHIAKLCIHSPTEPKDNWVGTLDLYERTMAALEALSAEYPWILLLPPLRLGMFSTLSIEDAETAWLDSCAGRQWW
ncbi:hypothetical protein K443DRAFT_573251 [Laccaria amethystina LaAM-08-1]|uniref:Uncharacterized protein n=1 Tax=Laccaria amethystina LaAM-08-1 TaxID=1095629 RepID=A0A0C9XUN0_9AGAR|nr:hypothetical protein K443DRAFT_573251 [Laccaria amethystina LaAM-08-1]